MKRNGCRVGLVLILITGLLFITGCWGKREVEELAPLISIGFDLGQKPNTYLVTGQYALPNKGAAGAEVKDWTMSFEASSLREAYEMTYKILNRTPFNGSVKVIVIGEDMAKAGFKDMLDFTQRFSEFRRTIYLVLTKGKAQDVLNVKLRNGEMPAMSIKNHLEQGDELSSFPTVRLGHYLTILGRKSTAPIMPLVKSIKSGDGGIEYKAEGKDGAEEIQLEGAGVFRGDRLVDLLTDEETKGYMWLENNVVHRFINTVGLEESKVNFSAHVLKSTTKYKVADTNGKIELQYQIKASVAVEEVLGQNEQLSETEWVELMKGAEKSFAKVIEKECELSIQKEKQLNLDFLGVGRHIEERNSAYWKTVKDQWAEKIADFPVSVNVEVTVHHSGMSNNSVINSTSERQE
ncbi:MAG TPA: Ger(x)C family spore germination protein [Desulfosporosinus sp.]